MFKATPESPRMFESDFIDFFSRTHFAVVPVLYLPAVAALLWHAQSANPAGFILNVPLCITGFVAWTLAEYWLHRLLFHWQPAGVWGERLHFWLHGVHHKWPRDKYRLVMPPAVSISLFWAFLGGFYVVLGTAWCWAFHAGFTLGYMYYDLAHYYIHHVSPKTQYARELKKHHMRHHHMDPESRYGVSWMVWDHVFGTFGESRPRKNRPPAPLESPGPG